MDEQSLFDTEIYLTRLLSKEVNKILTQDDSLLTFLSIHRITPPTQIDPLQYEAELALYKRQVQELALKEDFFCGIKFADDIVVPQVRFIKDLLALSSSLSEIENLLYNTEEIDNKKFLKRIIRRNENVKAQIERILTKFSQRSFTDDTKKKLEFMLSTISEGMTSPVFSLKSQTKPAAEIVEPVFEEPEPNKPVIVEKDEITIANEKYNELRAFALEVSKISNSSKVDENSEVEKHDKKLAEHLGFELELLEEKLDLGNVPLTDTSAKLLLEEIEMLKASIMPFINPMLYTIDYAKNDLPETIYYSSPVFRKKQTDTPSSPLASKFDKFLKQYAKLSSAELDYDTILNIVKAYLLAQELYADVEALKASTYLEPERFSVKI